MLNTLRQRMAKDEEGFTLIELMVVILIIAILMAIAIPTFLGAQTRAQDRGAQSNLRNALTGAKTVATDNSGLFVSTGSTVLTAANLAAAEPSIVFVDATDPAVNEVSVSVAAGGVSIALVAESASGTFYCMAATSGGTITKTKATAVAGFAAVYAVGTVGTCTGTAGW
ncbi:MAG: type II secretion system protein [Acidimicrobiales bacterium]